MHPFYEPSARLLAERRTARAGLWSMAAYLVFWAVAIPVALAVLGRALAGRPGATVDASTSILREGYARGDIDEKEFRRRAEVLAER